MALTFVIASPVRNNPNNKNLNKHLSTSTTLLKRTTEEMKN